MLVRAPHRKDGHVEGTGPGFGGIRGDSTPHATGDPHLL